MEGQNPQYNYEPEDVGEPERKPAIRTMRSDLEELTKSSKVSVTQSISEELKAHPPEVKFKKAGMKKTPFIVGGLILFLALAGLATYVFLLGPAPAEELTPARPPAPLFGVEREAEITVRLQERLGFLRQLEELMKEAGRAGTLTGIRLRIQDGPQERFAAMRDFTDLMDFNAPASLAGQFESDVMLFIYHGGDRNHLGFSAKTRDQDRVFREMLLWEPLLPEDLFPFFFNEASSSLGAEFEDRAYRNIDWRFAKISGSGDLGIAYTVFPANKLLVVTTGQEALEKVIDRLFETR